jgi:ribulose-phosphate 3-epimerase
MLDRIGSCAPIEVDGGIDLTTAGPMVGAGASILVAGTAIFGADDAERATREPFTPDPFCPVRTAH